MYKSVGVDLHVTLPEGSAAEDAENLGAAMSDLVQLASLGALGGCWAIVKERLRQIEELGHSLEDDDAKPGDGDGSLQYLAEHYLDQGEACDAGALCAAMLDQVSRYDAGKTS
jgi:hypothetical protein